MKLSARGQSAAEFQITPVRGQADVIRLRLQGVGCDDVEILLRPGHIAIREGKQPLTSEIPAGAPPVRYTGPVRMYYDAGILEV